MKKKVFVVLFFIIIILVGCNKNPNDPVSQEQVQLQEGVPSAELLKAAKVNNPLPLTEKGLVYGILKEGRTETSCIVLYDNFNVIEKYKFLKNGNDWVKGELVQTLRNNLSKPLDIPATVARWYKWENNQYLQLSSISFNTSWDEGYYTSTEYVRGSEPWIRKAVAYEGSQIIGDIEYEIDFFQWTYKINGSETEYSTMQQPFESYDDLKECLPTWVVTKTQLYPSVVSLSSPSDGAWLTTTSPTLYWSEPYPYDISKYWVQVSTSSTFSTTVYDNSNVVAQNVALSGLSDGTLYYWRAKAYNNYGWSKSWSSVRQFHVQVAPTAVTLSSPANNAVITSSSVTCSWTASAHGATPISYRFTIWDASTGGNVVVSQSNISGLSYQATNLSSDDYWWSVQPCSKYGTGDETWGAWVSPRRKFTIDLSPAPPTNVNYTGNANEHPVFHWTKSANATGYKVYKKIDGGSYTCVATLGDVDQWTDTWPYIDPEEIDLFYYAVKATNGASQSAYSNEVPIYIWW